MDQLLPTARIPFSSLEIGLVRRYVPEEEAAKCVSSFQAVCLGLFVLATWKTSSHKPPGLVPSALELFRYFLTFCYRFYGHSQQDDEKNYSHLTSAIDLVGARLMPRINSQPKAELYFVEVEETFAPASSKWMNVLHRLDPDALKEKAGAALVEWYSVPFAWNIWDKIHQDMASVVHASSGSRDTIAAGTILRTAMPAPPAPPPPAPAPVVVAGSYIVKDVRRKGRPR